MTRSARARAARIAAIAAALALGADPAGAARPGQDAAPLLLAQAATGDMPGTLAPLDSNALPLTPAAQIAAALRKADKAGALKIADDFLATHPRDAQVRFVRAVILGDLNRIDESVAALEALNEDYPELPEPYNNLAVIRANQGELALAEHYLELAIAAQPNYVTARENLGDLYISMAAAAYEQAALLDPDSAAVKKKLALTRELGGKLRSAR